MTRALSAVPPVHRIDPSASSIRQDVLIGPFETVGPGPWTERPHRHEFVEFAFLTGGTGSHHLDAESSRFSAPCFFVVMPGQLHHWEIETELTGWVVSFREEFLAVRGALDAIERASTAGGLHTLGGRARATRADPRRVRRRDGLRR